MNISSYLKLQKDLKLFRTSVRIPQSKIAKQMERVQARYSQQIFLSDQISKLMNASGIAVATQSLESAFKAIEIDTLRIEAITQIHKSWKETFLPAQNEMVEIQKSAKQVLGFSSYIAAIAESIRSKNDFAMLHASFNIEESVISRFYDSLASAQGSFSRLATSLAEMPRLAEMPSIVMPSASREILVSEYAIGELSSDDEQNEDDCYVEVVDDIREEVDSVQQLIHKVSPKLAIAHQGAKDVLKSKNADYARHVLSSLREMWNNLIWMLAPNDDVIPWIADDLQYMHEGKPTRKARLNYICREFNHEPLSSFLIYDTKAFIKMIDLFNRVHALDNELTDTQLKALILRSDSWLMFILQINEEGN